MSVHETSVKFRDGERDVEFEYEGDGVIVWNFADEIVCGGIGLTHREQDDVHEQLWNYMVDWWASFDDPH